MAEFLTEGILAASKRIDHIKLCQWHKLPEKFLRNRLSACAWISLVHVFQRQDDPSQDDAYTLPLVLHGVNAYKFYKLANALFGEKDGTQANHPWWLQRSCLDMEHSSFNLEDKSLCLTLTHPRYLKKLVQKGACINLMALDKESAALRDLLESTTNILCRRFFKEHYRDIKCNPKEMVKKGNGTKLPST